MEKGISSRFQKLHGDQKHYWSLSIPTYVGQCKRQLLEIRGMKQKGFHLLIMQQIKLLFLEMLSSFLGFQRKESSGLQAYEEPLVSQAQKDANPISTPTLEWDEESPPRKTCLLSEIYES